jgi:hypothetical protein
MAYSAEYLATIGCAPSRRVLEFGEDLLVWRQSMLTGSPVIGNQLPQRPSDFSERDIRSEAERNHLFVKNIS